MLTRASSLHQRSLPLTPCDTGMRGHLTLYIISTHHGRNRLTEDYGMAAGEQGCQVARGARLADGGGRSAYAGVVSRKVGREGASACLDALYTCPV